MAANLHKTNLMLMLTVLRDHIVMSHLHLAKMAALMWPGLLHSSFFITFNMKHAHLNVWTKTNVLFNTKLHAVLNISGENDQINIKLLIWKPSSAQHLSLCSPDGLLSNNRRLIRNKYSDCSAAADGKDARENPNCDVSSDGIRKMTFHHLLVCL